MAAKEPTRLHVAHFRATARVFKPDEVPTTLFSLGKERGQENNENATCMCKSVTGFKKKAMTKPLANLLTNSYHQADNAVWNLAIFTSMFGEINQMDPATSNLVK